VPGSIVGAVDEQGFKPTDAFVEGYGGEAAKTAGNNGDGKQPLPLRGHAPQQPGIKLRNETGEANPIAGFWRDLTC